MLQGFLEHEKGTKMPGQRKSARQQYRYDLLVNAAQDAVKALRGRRRWAQSKENVKQPAKAKRMLKTALREVGEDV